MPCKSDALMETHSRETELGSTLKAWLRLSSKLRPKKKVMARFEMLKSITLSLVGDPDSPLPKTVAQRIWSRSPSSRDTESSEKPSSSASLSRTESLS